MNINILGYGLMGKQIASLFYLGGFDIHIWNHSVIEENDIQKQIKLLKRILEVFKEGSLHFHTDINELPDSITIESVIEDLRVKKELFSYFSNNVSPYFTNSSSFSPTEIDRNVNGFHFFNPINLKLLELYFVNDSIQSSIFPIINYLKELQFEIVFTKNNRGYIGNYILFHEISSAMKLIEKYDYQIEQVNAIYKKLYDGRNIFQIIDVIGIDVVHKILCNLKEEDESIYLPQCLSLALKRNILGKKNKTSIKEVLA